MLLPASLRWISSIGFWGLSAGVIYQYTMYCQEVNTFPGGSPLLITIILLPALGALAITFISDENKQLQKVVALNVSLITFLLSLTLWIYFDSSISDFQFVYHANWLNSANIHLTLGIDGISLFFVILSALLIPICILTGWSSIQVYQREYLIALLILETCMMAVFCLLDVLLFYIFFESVLIPMFIIIGVWGSRQRKIRAAYQLFLYTLLGSVLMLLAILMIYFQTGTTDLQVLLTTEFSESRQILYWLAFFASFAVKVPMVPVHLWLPEAHVEAPTAGSVILAGILLKLGTYGFLRFSIPLFPEATLYFTPLVYTMSVVAIIYTSFTTVRQVDLKKIIAYSSVAHMNLVNLGMFSLNAQGVEGSLLLMLGHGLVSPALFLCIGALYDRHKTRLVRYYGGLVHTMPIFAAIFLFFTMGNIGLPGTSNFVGEFLVLAGCYQTNSIVGALATTGMILAAAYALWLYNRVVFGMPKPEYINSFSDLNRRELAMFLPLIICTLWMGVYPEVFLNEMHASVASLIQHGSFR